MKTKDAESLEKAMDAVSESIANFKRFVLALNAFLERHQLGGATWADLSNPVLYDDGKGYQIAQIDLSEPGGGELAYLDIYTDGTATGENFSTKLRAFGGGGGCTWDEAIKEILQTIGTLYHNPISRGKIEKIIELLG